MLEKDIERRMCESVKKRGGLTYKFVSPNCSGVPDRLVVTPEGVVWFVELKTDTGRLTKLQEHRIAELERHGANVRVVYGEKGMLCFVQEIFG